MRLVAHDRHPRLRSHLRSGVALVVALGLVVAACGGDDDAGSATAGATSETAEPTGGAGDTGTATAGGTTSASTSGTTADATTADATTTGSATTGTAGTTSSDAGGEAIDPTPGPGVTDDTISVGLTVQSRPANTAAGLGDADEGDDIEIANAIIDHINADGGIAGRQVVPVFSDRQGLSTQTPAQRTQQRCATFTQDNEVIAGFYQNIANDTDAACLTAAGGMFILTGGAPPIYFDHQSLAEDPNLKWNLQSPMLEDLYTDSVALLDEEGFFGDGAKVGILYQDFPSIRRAIDSSLAPALEALGLSIDGDAPTIPAEDPETFGQALAETQAAVVRFKSEGITHVLVLEGRGGVITGPFMSAAEEQDYHPAYMLNTTSGGIEVNPLTQADLSPQLANAVYLGWAEGDDDLGAENNEFADTCLGIVRDAGVDVGDREFVALWTCEFLFFLKAGFDAAEAPNADAFAAAVDGLGEMQFGATTARFGPGRRALADHLSVSTYDLECHASGREGCWVPTGTTREF